MSGQLGDGTEDDMGGDKPPSRTGDGRNDSERACFDRRVRGLEGSLRTFALSLAKDANAADELVQNTLIRMWERRDSYSGKGSYRAWAVAVMRNIWKMELRRSRRDGAVSLDEVGEVVDRRIDVEADRRAKRRARVVRAALKRLGRKERDALLARHVDDLPLAEVARKMEVSPKTADKVIRRACRKLRSMEDVLELALD